MLSTSSQASIAKTWLNQIKNANLWQHAARQSWPAVFKILNNSKNKEELINDLNLKGHNLLYYALLSPNEEVALTLLKMNANPYITYNIKSPTLASLKNNLNSLAIKNSAQKQTAKTTTVSSLSLAVMQNRPKVVSYLSSLTPSLLSSALPFEDTPLMTAVELSNDECFLIMLKSSSLKDLEATNSYGETIFNLLCYKKNHTLLPKSHSLDLLKALLVHAPNFNTERQDLKGSTALMNLCASPFEYPKGMYFRDERVDKLKFCLEHCKNIDLQNNDGMTVLMILLENSNFNAINSVLSLSPNCLLSNSKGETVLDILKAQQLKYKRISSTLFCDVAALSSCAEAINAVNQKNILTHSVALSTTQSNHSAFPSSDKKSKNKL